MPVHSGVWHATRRPLVLSTSKDVGIFDLYIEENEQHGAVGMLQESDSKEASYITDVCSTCSRLPLTFSSTSLASPRKPFTGGLRVCGIRSKLIYVFGELFILAVKNGLLHKRSSFPPLLPASPL